MFRQTYCNYKNYPYSLRDLDLLAHKTSIFLLDQFQSVFRSIRQRESEPRPSIPKGKKKRRITLQYDSITMETLDMAKLPLGYSTGYPPVLEKCDHCHEPLLYEQEQCQILICGHGYHTNCYVSLDFRCRHCLEYLKKGIQQNVESFLNRLNSGTDELIEDDTEDIADNEDEGEENEEESLNNNEIECIQVNLNERLQKMDAW